MAIVAENHEQGWRRELLAPTPCTSEDLVAIDKLLEIGDKRAAKLAVACKRGGGILEGSRRRRK